MAERNVVAENACLGSDLSRVFISYAHRDDFSAKPIDQYLRNHGVQTAIDDSDFIPGQWLLDEIARNITPAGKVVFIYSVNSAGRKYPELERSIAKKLEIERLEKGMLIFFRLDDTNLPKDQRERIAINAYEMSFQTACERLLAAIIGRSIPPPTLDLHDFAEKPPWKMNKDERASILKKRQAELRASRDYDSKLTYAIESLRHKNRMVKIQATKDLGRLRDPRAVPALIDALEDDDAVVRYYVAKTLGKIGDPKALDALVKLAQNGTEVIRNDAIMALGGLGDVSRDVLEEILREDEDAEARRLAVMALGAIGNLDSEHALIEALNDTQIAVRAGAADALGEIGDQKAVNPLLRARLNDDEDSSVRWSAGNALYLVLRRCGIE